MSQGKILDYGNYDHLLKSSSEFRKMNLME